ncbi:MAG: hypothetical protein J6B68_01400 [Lachnospiraceae bacterium]|nr:hypothetical protein [Lachnospiraceae bacterium]
MGVFAEYVGSRNIPEDKREEFTERVLEILRQGGMMQLEQVAIYNKKIGLLQPPVLDEEGKVEFHYNYFEDNAWEVAGYYSQQNHFWSNKIGSLEFNCVVLAVYVLYEFYTDDFGMATECGEIIDARKIVGWLNYLFHEQYTNARVSDPWKVYEWIHENGCTTEYMLGVFDVEEVKLLSLLKYAYVDMGFRGLEIIKRKISSNQDEKKNEALRIIGLVEQLEAKISKIKETSELSMNEEIDFLLEAIAVKLNSREEQENSEKYNQFLSFCVVLPPEIVIKSITQAYELEFWDVWEKFKGNVPHEEVCSEKSMLCCMPVSPVKIVDFLDMHDSMFFAYDENGNLGGKGFRISDDDRAYFWAENGDVHFSEKMKCWLKDLKLKYDELMCEEWKLLPENEFMDKMITLLNEADEIYKRIFAFQDMFYNFVMHANEKPFQTAIILFEQLINSNRDKGAIVNACRHSWEFTNRKMTFNEGRLAIKRYLAVLANQKLRKRVFGF